MTVFAGFKGVTCYLCPPPRPPVDAVLSPAGTLAKWVHVLDPALDDDHEPLPCIDL